MRFSIRFIRLAIVAALAIASLAVAQQERSRAFPISRISGQRVSEKHTTDIRII